MRTLLSAVAVCSLLSLTACNSTAHKDHDGHDHADGVACCTTTGTCCKTSDAGLTKIGADAKKECVTCKTVGKDNCTTCKK